jgi:hypothetical protein
MEETMAKRVCMSVTKSGKPSKHGRYRKCKSKHGKKWGPVRKKHG